MSKDKANGFAYQLQLDGLRAIAILMVAWSHWMPPDWQGGLPWGHFGVQLFFVLSAFLISRILLALVHSDGIRISSVLKAFFVRRALRIFPVYYSLLLVLWTFDVGDTRPNLFWHLFYVSNIRIFLQNDFATWLAHFWTLCVEEQFYLLWPGVIVLGTRTWLIRVCVAVISAAPFFRVAVYEWLPEHPPTVLLLGVMDAFGAGVLLAISARDSTLSRTYRRLQLGVALPLFFTLQVIAIYFPLEPSVEAVRQTSMVLFFAAIIHRAAFGFSGVLGRILSCRWSIGLGRISYGMYLIHNFIPHALDRAWRNFESDAASFYSLHPLSRFCIFLAITVGIASASWRFIECPILSLKTIFPYPSAEPFRKAAPPLS